MKREKRNFARGLLIAILLTGAGACSRNGGDEKGGQGGGPPGQMAPTVLVETVSRKPLVDKIEALGTVRANESIELTSTVTEIVESILFSEGMEVNQDAVLVELRKKEEQALLDQAREDVVEQKREYKRIQNLVENNAAPKSRLDEILSDLNRAEANQRVVEARLENLTIRAPFTGVLGLRRISTGALVQPGTVITTLDDLSKIKLNFTVPESYLKAVSVGQSIRARGEAFPDDEFKGKITVIEPRVDPVSRSVTVQAVIPNPFRKLRPGMLMTVNIIKEETEAILIPEEALSPLKDKQFVFVTGEDNTVEQREVQIGRRIAGNVEIVSGLEPGEKVIVEGAIKVRPGTQVNPRERGEPESAAAS